METGRFCRLFGALPSTLKLPAMINATYLVALDPAKMHLRATVRTAIGNYLRLTGLAAIDGVVFAHDANGFGAADG